MRLDNAMARREVERVMREASAEWHAAAQPDGPGSLRYSDLVQWRLADMVMWWYLRGLSNGMARGQGQD